MGVEGSRHPLLWPSTLLLGAALQCGTLKVTEYEMMRAIVVASGCHAIAVPNNGPCAGNLLLSAQVVNLSSWNPGGRLVIVIFP